jgi:hypothetical protein
MLLAATGFWALRAEYGGLSAAAAKCAAFGRDDKRFKG